MKGFDFRHFGQYGSWMTFIQRFGGWSPLLAVLVFEITHRCNLDCKMCPQATSRKTHARILDMPVTTLARVIEDASTQTPLKPFVHLIGGEPLLHPHFIEMVAYIKDKKMRCSVTTNGSLLERYAHELVRLGTNDVRISLDGPERIHNDIRGAPWAFARAVRGLEALLGARRANGGKSPHVSINCVISAANYHHLSDLLDIAARLGVGAVTFQHLMFPDGTAHGMDIEYLSETLSTLRAKGKQRHVRVSFYPRLSDSQIPDYYQEPSTSFGGTCILPWFVAWVLPDGSITPCRGFVIGQVAEEGFSLKKIWNGPAARGYRKSIVSNGLFADCDRCCHRLYKGALSKELDRL